MYASSWFGLISIIGLRRNNSKARERIRLSFRKEGISGQTSTIITDLKGILLGNLGLQLLK